MLSKILSIVSAAALGIAGCGAAAVPDAATKIPSRTFRCKLGHALNLDPAKEQRMDEIRYEGSHEFAVFIPAAISRGKPALDSADPTSAADPATRVLADPSGLRRGVPAGFARIVDLWPERVELTQTIERPLVHFMVINQIDETTRTANLFMTTATDVASMNLKTVYQGRCHYALGAR